MRQTISIGIEIASPHMNEASTKSAVVARNRRTWPKRCVSQPVSGTEMALATANEVMIHVPWFGETPRSPAIAGIDTLAIETSSTFMKVASATAIEAAKRAPPSKGCAPLRSSVGCACATGRPRPGGDDGLGDDGVLGDDLLDARIG